MASRSVAVRAERNRHAERQANLPRTPAVSRAKLVNGIRAGRAEQVADVLRALGHPLRLRIVALLCQQELFVNELAERLGVAQVTTSQQLRILRLTRLVEVTRAAGQARYRLAMPELRELVGCVARCAAHGEVER